MTQILNQLVTFFLKQKRFGLFLILFISAWYVLSSSIVYLMPLSALKKNCGQIEYLDRETFKCSSGRYSVSTCAKTTIRLKEVSATFRIRTGINDGGLIGGISLGDTICIYSRHWYQFFLELGSLNTIWHLEKDADVYYEFEWIKEQSRSKILVWGIICVVFLVFLILEINTVKAINKRKTETTHK